MADLIAVLDANVLFPMSLCDTLLRCGQANLYRPLWSVEILDEFSRNLIAQGRVTPEQAARRALHMQGAFPQATVSGYEGLVPALLCDPKDRHVLAVAIHGGAQMIITKNLSDFPAPAVQPSPWGRSQMMQPQEWDDRYGPIKSAFSRLVTAYRDQIVAGAAANEIVAHLQRDRYLWIHCVAVEQASGCYQWHPAFLEALRQRCTYEKLLGALQLDRKAPAHEQRTIMLNALVPESQQQGYSSHEIVAFVEGLFAIDGGIARHRLTEWAEERRTQAAIGP